MNGVSIKKKMRIGFRNVGGGKPVEVLVLQKWEMVRAGFCVGS